MQAIAVHFYDGKSSRRHHATLATEGSRVRVSGDWGQREAELADTRISEPMGSAPRTLHFADGSYCEVGDTAGLAGMLAAIGHREPLSVRMQRRWSVVLTSLAAVIAMVVASYLWLLPAVADAMAPRLPSAWVAALSQASLESLDAHLLEPSKLPPQREAELSRRMAAFAAAGKLPAYTLRFRAAPKDMPPNAFALPDGTIVIFDALLEQLSEEEALAVFAHELGHVAHHHGMRMLIQSAVVSTVAAVYLGDLSSLVAALSTAMLQSNYSQSFESEADRYAARALQRDGKPAMLLATALEKLEAAAQEASAPKRAHTADWLGRILSSHPSIARRSEALRAMTD